MKIIALGHRKRTGKDTLARFLVTELRLKYSGLNIKKLGFADKVKDIAFQVYGWGGLHPGVFYEQPENEHLREVVLPKLGKTPRQIWIGVGNGIRAACDLDDCWLLHALESYKADVLIFKDLRFVAEAEGILARGGKIYRLDCPWAPIATDGADNVLANYTNWNRIFLNDEKDNYNKLYGFARDIIAENF